MKIFLFYSSLMVEVDDVYDKNTALEIKKIEPKEYKESFINILSQNNHHRPVDRINDVIDKKEHIWYGCFSENTIVGFACFYFEGKNFIKLEHVAVLPNFQNSGVGWRLMNSYKEYMKNNNISTPQHYFLEAMETNIHAINYYKKRNFIEVDQSFISRLT